ncbi:MAG: DnaJ domain-containing protein, partial [Desulforhopalus sp.]
MPKNYYIILGIPINSSKDDIKAAYRRLAKEYHPDYYGKNQAPFQIIQEAYSVLSNPKTRRVYDRSLQHVVRKSPSGNLTPGKQYHESVVEPLIPPDEAEGSQSALGRSFHNQWSSFDDIFDHFLGGFVERPGPEFRGDNDVTIEITLTPLQAQSGGNVRLNLPVEMRCPSCYRQSGYGCWRCNGTGVLRGERP